MSNRLHFTICLTSALVLMCNAASTAGDWPMLGLNGTRNAVSPEKGAPLDWSIGKWDYAKSRWYPEKARNIKWRARLGDMTFGTPIVAGGSVFIGTNGTGGHVKPHDDEAVGYGYLHCFRAADAKFLWTYSTAHLKWLRWFWTCDGISSTPLVEGNRLWFVTNRYEVVCLDTRGFRDKKNDGPFVDETSKSPTDADIVWRYDLIKKAGVYPFTHVRWNPNRQCSPVAYGDRLYIVTGNGTKQRNQTIPSPKAPSLICFDKRTGKVLWTDASPGKNILRGQFGDPIIIKVKGRAQVVVGQGDGWVRSFDVVTGKLIWKFDINPKQSKYASWISSSRNSIMTNPVYYKGRLYLGSGRIGEFSQGPGRLVCIDPTKTGDISAQLVVDSKGRALPERRFQAVDPKKGEKAIPNRNSGLVWEFTNYGKPVKGEYDFLNVFHRTTSSVVIKNDLLIAVDSCGLVHCLNAKTGKRHWVCDTWSESTGSPLIVEDRVYVPTNDHDIAICRLSTDPDKAIRKVKGEYRPRRTITMDRGVNGSPVFANGVLYIASRNNLWAIVRPKREPAGRRVNGRPKKK